MERAGEEPFPPEVQRVLAQNATDEIVSIKPNGAIYVAHPIYRNVLDAAFGVGGWALVPLEPPRIKGNRAIWYGYLKAHGRYIDSAYGGCDYVPSNRTMNEDDAVEGAKSDCLTRCCKSFPLFRNLWDHDYAEEWKQKYAYEVVDRKNPDRKIWKKKGQPMPGIEGKPGRGHQSEWRKPPDVRKEQEAHVEAVANEGSLRMLARDEYQEDPEYQWDREESEQ